MIVSKISMIPLGCRHEKAKHVMSFWRQLYMVLPDRGDDTGLKVSFKIRIEDRDYQMYASSATLTCFLCGNFGHLKRFCPKAHCARCGESGHVDVDCKTDNDRKPRGTEEVIPLGVEEVIPREEVTASISNVSDDTISLHGEDEKDGFVTVKKKRKASTSRESTSSSKVVVLDTSNVVTEEPQDESIIQKMQCGNVPSNGGETELVIGGETSAERTDESSPTTAFPEPELNSVLTPRSHTTSIKNTVSVTPVEVPDEEVQEDALAVASQVEESANQCSQRSTPHHPVDPLESLLNEVIKDQSEFCEPDGFLSGLSDSDDNIEVADLSQ